MTDFIKLIIMCFYILIGIVSLIMAYKNIFSKKFISFHQQTAGKSLNDLDEGLQMVIISLMRVSGLGFLIVALLLIVFPVINYFGNNLLIRFSIPALSFVFCFGLFIVNFQLYKRTKVKTPWKGALASSSIIAANLLISLLI